MSGSTSMGSRILPAARQAPRRILRRESEFVGRITELIEEFGPHLGRPHTAPLGRGLFEIRAKGREGIARSVFCTVKGEEIVIAKAGVPLAKLISAVKQKGKRKPGGWEGKIRIADNFDDPLPVEFQAAFEGRVYED